MTLSKRLRIIAPGSLLVLTTGCFAAWVAAPNLFTNPRPLESFINALTFFVFAPVYLAVDCLVTHTDGYSVPAYMVALGATASVAVVLHPLLRMRWAGIVTIVGLVAWIVCQGLMVLAPMLGWIMLGWI